MDVEVRTSEPYTRVHIKRKVCRSDMAICECSIGSRDMSMSMSLSLWWGYAWLVHGSSIAFIHLEINC